VEDSAHKPTVKGSNPTPGIGERKLPKDIFLKHDGLINSFFPTKVVIMEEHELDTNAGKQLS
jgi:hypothetical protein